MIYLDIVIVNWNAGDQLTDCLASFAPACQDPTFKLSKCIVVDNASTDGSAEHLAALPFPIEVIRNRANTGFASASNQGARAGSSEYILFLNPDVRLFPDSLTRPLAFLADPLHERVGVVGLQLVGEGGAVQRNVTRFPTPGDLFFQMLGFDRLFPRQFPPLFMSGWDYGDSRVVDQVPGAFFLIRRGLFESLGGFDERFFMYFEDLDLAFRARRAGFTSYYLAEARVFHRGGGTTSQVKASRLFYILRSRAQYVAKQYGRVAALAIIVASLCVEFWLRCAWSLLRLSPRDCAATAQAYARFILSLPGLFTHPELE